MDDKIDFEACRLCLKYGELLIDILDENNKLDYYLEKTIEDLICVKVFKTSGFPWLVCSTCREKLGDFRDFKRRSAVCVYLFYNRIEKMSCQVATEDRTTKIQEFAGDIKEEVCDNAITSCATEMMAVDLQNKIISEKEEGDDASEYSATSGADVNLSMADSMQESGSHRSDNEESENSEDWELHLSSDEEVDIKEECDADILKRKGAGEGGEVLEAQDCHQGEDDEQKNDTENFNHKCQICNKAFAKSDLLKVHVMSVHLKKETQLSCDICSEAFESISDLQGHVASVHAMKKKHHCQYCSRYFQNPSELENHIGLTHIVRRLYKCKLCSRGFSQNGNLKRHMMSHTGERPHKCKVCSKAFSLKQHLQIHNLSHTDNRPHKCELCSKAFIQHCDLKRHILTHKGERPHKCELCSKAFTLKQNLNSHMRVHTQDKPYKCPICSKAFTQHGVLRRHTWTHTGDRPYKCGNCSKSFTRKHQLKKHSLMHANARNN